MQAKAFADVAGKYEDKIGDESITKPKEECNCTAGWYIDQFARVSKENEELRNIIKSLKHEDKTGDESMVHNFVSRLSEKEKENWRELFKELDKNI